MRAQIHVRALTWHMHAFSTIPESEFSAFKPNAKTDSQACVDVAWCSEYQGGGDKERHRPPPGQLANHHDVTSIMS